MARLIFCIFVLGGGCESKAQQAASEAPPPYEDASGFGIAFPAQPDPAASETFDVDAASLSGDLGGADATSADVTAAVEAADDDADLTPVDAVPDGACSQSIGAGDIVIEELMIESVAGSGDDGEWIEVQSTLDCTVDLRGLHAECPHGAKVVTLDVTDDVWIPPRGTFVMADSLLSAVNHYLPGTVIAWSGHPGDVLRNDGTTVTLSFDGVLIDAVTYPELSLKVGSSLSFPSDCPLDLRTDWTKWQPSTSSWFSGFYGTPNAPNSDVSCP
jgi:hypothetical protein